MIFSYSQTASRPVAAVMALAFVAAFWLPTVSSPAQAADAVNSARSEHALVVIVAPAAPALM